MSIDLKDKKWWVQETTAWLQLCYPWMRGFVETHKYYKPATSLCLTIYKDDYIWSVNEEKSDFAFASGVHDKFHDDPAYLDPMLGVWRDYRDELEAIFEGMRNTELTGSSAQDLSALYQEFFRCYKDVFAPALLCEAFVPYAEQYLIPEISKLTKAAGLGKGERIAGILTVPSHPSYLTRERIELLSIALSVLDDPEAAGLLATESDIGAIRERSQVFFEALAEHQRNYFWIKNNYKDDEPISIEEFLSYIREDITKGRQAVAEELERLENNPVALAKEKNELMALLKPDEKLTTGIKLFEIVGEWQDERKAIMQKASYYLTILLRAIAQQIGLPFELVAYATPEEISSFLDGKTRPTPEILEDRRKFCAVIITEGSEEILTGNKAQEVWDQVFTQGQAREKAVYGTVACTGRVRGKVRIVKDPAKDAFEEGEILVTSMTRPEFVPYMKKALAIVTDEGGLTCHAAIVSRELNVPCIVGTKVATKVLKDGDYVEVNASHGSVTKL